ncbi:MAG TPA: proton-conducting transporter membrane subunit [Myxococcota bacterium]|nr:proton-conducting transporter membrane subunit [Myxococcota bacterium]
MLVALIALPVLAAVFAALLPSERRRPIVLPLAAAGHLALALTAVASDDPAAFGGWLALDPPGRLVLLLLSVLFALCAVYAVGYLHYRGELSNRVFVPCLLAFLAMTTLVVCAQHLGLMWVAVEASTLATAPLIYFNRTPRSIEATWKYLLVGSVGIALALLGSFALAYASIGSDPSLLFGDLLARADRMDRSWLHVAFALLLVGYGAKMGLAPMHSWKPDAYGEAPGVVGALLAGGLTNCAFLALVRVFQICQAAGEGAYASRLLITFGLLSIAVAAAFLVGQRDFKRMLAYSSIEHMGILVLGIGLGAGALFAALLHMLNNGIAKGVLFLSAANIHRAFDSKSIDEVRGAMRRVPLSGTLFLFGFFAITGSPPFGPFVSEFLIVSHAFAAERFFIASAMLLLLLVVFVGMGRTVLAVVQGLPSPEAQRTSYRDGLLTGLPVLCAMAIVLLLGLHIPPPLEALLREGAAFLEQRP